jgi:glycosyltransferase involved in cell wall biosynthesis
MNPPKTNILYIGNFKDGTGWGEAAAGNVFALDSVAEFNVIPSVVTYKNSGHKSTPEIDQIYHNNKHLVPNVIIQHVLPHLYHYDSRFLNIGFLDCESYDFKSTGWQNHINIMDQLWVPSENNREIAMRSGVKIPIYVVPHSIDISRYNRDAYSNGLRIKELENSYNFGFVGEFIQRKNIKALIQAFHLEFEPEEPVNLLLKTSGSVDAVQKFCSDIKMGLKTRKRFKNELIITDRMQDDDYRSILCQIDTFVMPSRGEGFCIPALECQALGSNILYTQGVGMEWSSGREVDSSLEYCFGAMEGLPSVDTADSEWWEISISHLRKEMRVDYESFIKRFEKPHVKNAGSIASAKQFNHKHVGALIWNILR